MTGETIEQSAFLQVRGNHRVVRCDGAIKAGNRFIGAAKSFQRIPHLDQRARMFRLQGQDGFKTFQRIFVLVGSE